METSREPMSRKGGENLRLRSGQAWGTQFTSASLRGPGPPAKLQDVSATLRLPVRFIAGRVAHLCALAKVGNDAPELIPLSFRCVLCDEHQLKLELAERKTRAADVPGPQLCKRRKAGGPAVQIRSAATARDIARGDFECYGDFSPTIATRTGVSKTMNL
jgi:hypothetical protein